MNLRKEHREGAVVVTVDEARIDAAVAIQFKDRMREVTAGEAGRVILDMAAVDFLDSSGLGAVVAALKMLAPEQRLELSGLSPTVAKVFRLTRMDGVFVIHADLDSALAAGLAAQ